MQTKKNSTLLYNKTCNTHYNSFIIYRAYGAYVNLTNNRTNILGHKHNNLQHNYNTQFTVHFYINKLINSFIWQFLFYIKGSNREKLKGIQADIESNSISIISNFSVICCVCLGENGLKCFILNSLQRPYKFTE